MQLKKRSVTKPHMCQTQETQKNKQLYRWAGKTSYVISEVRCKISYVVKKVTGDTKKTQLAIQISLNDVEQGDQK